MISSKRIFDFYLNSSIHVALSVFALVEITKITNHIPNNDSVSIFAFLGTIVGYNFVKYYTLAKSQKRAMSLDLKLIAFISFCSLFGCAYYFFQLEHTTQFVSIGVLLLILLYTLPFFPNKSNVRNWAGVKIYVVSVCWVVVTLIIPILNTHLSIGLSFLIIFFQRFILILVLILIFEIIDLPTDNPELKTVPQKIGVSNTKILGTIFLAFYFLLGFFQSNHKEKNIITNAILVLVLFTLIIFANEKRSKYYTSVWAESVPLFWWFLIVYFQN